MRTEVVNITTRQPFDVYIGRACTRARDRRCHVASVFANPYRVAPLWKLDGAGRRVRDSLACTTAEEAVERYQRDLMARAASSESIRARLMALKGKRLGCWCHPDPCHGHAIVRVLDWVERGMPEGEISK